MLSKHSALERALLKAVLGSQALCLSKHSALERALLKAVLGSQALCGVNTVRRRERYL